MLQGLFAQHRQPTMMSSSSPRDSTARLRAGLNPLLTGSLGGYHGHSANTPVSAMSVSSHGAFSSAQTPLSAIQPYNPQEWIASPVAGPAPDRIQHAQQPVQSYQEPQSESVTVFLSHDF